jgi:hypothetical protein
VFWDHDDCDLRVLFRGAFAFFGAFGKFRKIKFVKAINNIIIPASNLTAKTIISCLFSKN